MWTLKDPENVVFVDIEKRLQRKPTLFCDNIVLPFQDGSFDTVFFDPPHAWNKCTHPFFSFPNKELRYAKYPNMIFREATQYYGIDRYKTRSQLVKYLFRAEKELYRVLKSDSILWMRWTEMDQMTAHRALAIFQNWNVCLKHQIFSCFHNTSDCNSYWFALMKKPRKFVENEILNYE